VSQISVPQDNSANPIYKVLRSQIPFEIRVTNPCLSSVLEAFSVDNIETSVFGQRVEESLVTRVPADSVSRRLGDHSGQTYCGGRQFRIKSSGHESFLGYNPSLMLLTLLSTNKNDVGSVRVTIEAYLSEYPSVVTSTTFTATITACSVASLQPTTTPDQRYDVNNPATTFTINPFTQVPNCESPVTYQVFMSSDNLNFSGLPPWITRNLMQLRVATSDFSLIGIYWLRVTATVV